MSLRQRLASGSIYESEFRRQIAESDFGIIPNWSGKNPFARNYTDFVDSVSDPKPVWNHVKTGVAKSLEESSMEKEALAS